MRIKRFLNLFLWLLFLGLSSCQRVPAELDFEQAANELMQQHYHEIKPISNYLHQKQFAANAAAIYRAKRKELRAKSFLKVLDYPEDWDALSDFEQLLFLQNNADLRQLIAEDYAVFEQTVFLNKVLAGSKKRLKDWGKEDVEAFKRLILQLDWGKSKQAFFVDNKADPRLSTYYIDPYEAEAVVLAGGANKQAVFALFLLDKLLLEEEMSRASKHSYLLCYQTVHPKNRKDQQLHDYGDIFYRYELEEKEGQLLLKKHFLNDYKLFIH
ncbi:hypothetical protein [Saprospira grandis]|uniref:hypothetical protein n=1 Tax=Saprospira grandis TaxID=1008 RepID=UPI0022DDAA23|nr:hypothetical protein [Saprospira grandis]WBM74925.1 hypothetical protein OP864_01540 [Saprospira grandis]